MERAQPPLSINETPTEPPAGQAAARRVLLGLLAVQAVMIAVSLASGRMFLFEDDLIRLNIVLLWIEHNVEVASWGGDGWLPFPVWFLTGVKKLLPISYMGAGLTVAALLSLTNTFLLQRLGECITNGYATLIPAALHVLMPQGLWLGTSVMSESYLTAANLAAMLCLCCTLTRPNREILFAMGGALALAAACLTRHEAWFTVLPAALMFLAWRVWACGLAGAWRLGVPLALACGAPLAWSYASWRRFGDPFAALTEFSARLTAHNLQKTPAQGWLQMGEAVLEANACVVLLAIAAGGIALWRHTPRLRQRESGAVLLPLLVGGSTAALLLYSVATMRHGWPLGRFVYGPTVMLLPLTALLGDALRGMKGVSARASVLGVATCCMVAGWVAGEVRRIDARADLGFDAAIWLDADIARRKLPAPVPIAITYFTQAPDALVHTMVVAYPHFLPRMIFIDPAEGLEHLGDKLAANAAEYGESDYLVMRWSHIQHGARLPVLEGTIPPPKIDTWDAVQTGTHYVVYRRSEANGPSEP